MKKNEGIPPFCKVRLASFCTPVCTEISSVPLPAEPKDRILAFVVVPVLGLIKLDLRL